ncbi:MAG: DEAD/DEAH box helicase [Thiothrix sp.]|nr:MAG: DEAD/DEAH box helicase [Thiothrix sp.]
MHFTPHHAQYFAYELSKRSSSNSMQKLASTLVDAQVDLNPHQVEAALFAFQSPLSKGAILADEVGLGKTIEAGLVISQKWAESKRKILIITPANLRKQWSQELQDKFFLPSIILEAKSFNDCIKNGNLNPFEQQDIILCSYQFAKTKDAYLKQVQWDLVVIDEAHRLRNVYKVGNKIARAIKEALEPAPKILLTATPLQNSLLELYGLVSIIDDYAFGDVKSFKTQYSRVNSAAEPEQFSELKERLKPICKRTLRRQVLEYIRYTNRIALVEEFYPSSDENRLYELVSEYLQAPNLYALPASQRSLMTLILRRLLASSTYAISGTLAGLAVKLENIIEQHQEQNRFDAELGLSLLEVQDNFETYDELNDEWEGDEEPKEDTVYTPADIENMRLEVASLKEFASLAQAIQKNSKGEKLFTALANGFQELDRLGAAKKAIIFTESKRTQEYLRTLLEGQGYAGKVVLFNGTNTDTASQAIYQAWVNRYRDTDKVTDSRSADMRAALVDYFREEATIMIATEAAAEGINLQFCSLVINYDLPWNPQRIEQRIGRCHRYGQPFDVVVVNFLNKANAADQRVYELLNDKFKLFDGVFGASDEVLGSIESGVDFEKRIARIYQECRTTQQIEQAFNELQAELEGSISQALQQTRQQLLENFDEEVHEKLKINLQTSREYLSKYEHWLWSLTQVQLSECAQFDGEAYRFCLHKNPFTALSIPLGDYQMGKQVEEAHVYRISHPLAQGLIEQAKTKPLDSVHLVFHYTLNKSKISILESLHGLSGWLVARSVTISSLEIEDYLLLAGLTTEGVLLTDEQCRRLFSLQAETGSFHVSSQAHLDRLDQALTSQKMDILGTISSRNAQFFELELDKLDQWGEDKRSSLKITLKDLDEQIKELKKHARVAPNLPEKLKLEKQRKQYESERDSAWREYDRAAKEIDQAKDRLIEQIEAKLSQALIEKDLFMISWSVV